MTDAVLQRMEASLRLRRGKHDCNDLNGEPFWVTYADIEQNIKERYGFGDPDTRHSFTYGELLAQLVALLNRGERQIQVGRVAADGRSLVDFEQPLHPSNIGHALFYSSDPVYSFACQIKLKLRENLLLIVGTIVSITWLYVQIKNFFSHRRYKALSSELYKDILGDLKNMHGGVSGLSQNDMLRKYMDLPPSSDGLSRDEAAFHKYVWPLLEQQRIKEKKVTTFQRQQFGKVTNIWQLK